MRKVLLSLGALALLSACGTTTRFARTNGSPVAEAPRSPQSVQVFTVTMPNRPFMEVGIVEAQQSSTLSHDDMPEVIENMREEAASRGCDGIILLSANDRVVGGEYDGTGWTQTLKGYRGACIVYQDALQNPPAPSAAPGLAG